MPSAAQPIQLPVSPPPLHTRSTNDNYDDMPGTPTRGGFTTPQMTPQGSPSKHHVPPGAYDLPNVFENAMKLLPTFGTPSKNGQNQQTANSPGKNGTYEADEQQYDYPAYHQADVGHMPASPTKHSNKENTPAGQRPALSNKSSFINQAAASRQEAYKTREVEPTSAAFSTQRGLSREDLDKLQKPAVKRLANVTQLCKYTEKASKRSSADPSTQTSSTTTSISSATSTAARTDWHSSRPRTLPHPQPLMMNIKLPSASILAVSGPI